MAGWHLEYNIDVDAQNRIVYEKIFGVWKVHTAEAYVRDFEQEVEPVLDRPWAKLVDLSNWKAGYPEIVAIIGRHLAWCRKHNMVWSVNIIRNPSTFKQLHKMFGKGGTRDLSVTFRTREEGEAFLRERGFTVKSSSGSGTGRPPRW
jgi:hypothetical protein